MALDLGRAKTIFIEEALRASSSEGAAKWIAKVERLSQACEEVGIRTHVAFLGTAILAKAVDLRVDAFSVKATKGKSGAYSARSLAHGVLVPCAAELGINLGVNGREPLNNQPYFRMERVDDDTRVRLDAKKGIMGVLLEVIADVQAIATEAEAKEALRSFIQVRRKYQPSYQAHQVDGQISPAELVIKIRTFVESDSEGGKRAQAVVAGLLDVFAGPERVASGKINDPSRHFPGDISLRPADEDPSSEKAIEVRDKPVNLSDILIFARKCLGVGIREAVVVAVSPKQTPIPVQKLAEWGEQHSASITLFFGWDDFITQALFWSEKPQTEAANLALSAIYDRLVEFEISEEGANHWLRSADSL